MSLGIPLHNPPQGTAQEWLERARCRGRRTAMAMTPTPYHIALRRAAKRLPPPDACAPGLLAAAAPVAALQRAALGGSHAGALRGRFTLLNQAFDFGAPDAIPWRSAFRDAAGPSRRAALARMGYAVPLLARGDRACLDAVAAILCSLEAQNGWSVGGVFRDVWSPQTASHRLINLLAGLALYRDRGGEADPERETPILDHARFCAAFLLRNPERGAPPSRLFKNHVALAVYGASLPRLPPELAFLRTAIPHGVRRTVLRDGGHAERSPMVHALTLVDLRILRATGLFPDQWRPVLDSAAARMESALAVMTHPDGDIALFNGSFLGEAPPSADLVQVKDAPEVCRLPETGYVRIGRGGDAILFDCGAGGPEDVAANGHRGHLSLELSAGGERLLVGPGVETAAHGKAPAAAGEIADATLAGLAPLWCAGWQSGGERMGPRHRRFVGLWPREGALVCDLWQGLSLGAERAGFLVAAPWQIVTTAPLTLADGSRKLRVMSVAGALGRVSSTVCSPRAGAAEPATRIEVEATGSAERSLAVWFSWSGKPPPPEDAILRTIDRLGA